jgi:gas vesicle protein
MLTFLIGLSLGACIGAVVAGVCRASYEHQPQADSDAANPRASRPV